MPMAAATSPVAAHRIRFVYADKTTGEGVVMKRGR
jgi:hypothetical protein